MARLEYRSASAGLLGDFFGADWPDWIRALRGKSGVYVIRQADAGRVLYVGESHTGALKKTLLRHFQSWTGKTAGPTYGRGAVEIAVEITPPGRAVSRQNSLICKLQPRDNTLSPVCALKPENPF